MTMPQLIDAERFNPAETLWTADAPDGERLDEYVANEVNGTDRTTAKLLSALPPMLRPAPPRP